MKKVARLRIAQEEAAAEVSNTVRTTGRIKKPKAVFDPSDNYLPRAQQRLNSTHITAPAAAPTTASNTSVERRKDATQQMQLELQSHSHSLQHSKRASSQASSSSQYSRASTPMSTTSVITATEACYVCLKKDPKRAPYAKNKLIACLDCDKKVHKACLKVDFEDLETLRANYKCEKCCTCEICQPFTDLDPKIGKELITCAKCVKSYHLTCHIPSVLKFPQLQRSWKCNKCTSPTPTAVVAVAVATNSNSLPAKAIREIIGDEPRLASVKSSQSAAIPIVQAKTTVAAVVAPAAGATSVTGIKRTNPVTVGVTAVPEKKLKVECSASVAAKPVKSVDLEAAKNGSGRYNPNEPIDIPNVKNWTYDEVAEYFAKYFPKEAQIFKEQEIDGTSLLLLRRGDIVKKLSIKLGPSVRMYSLILKIQTGQNDATLGWNNGI